MGEERPRIIYRERLSYEYLLLSKLSRAVELSAENPVKFVSFMQGFESILTPDLAQAVEEKMREEARQVRVLLDKFQPYEEHAKDFVGNVVATYEFRVAWLSKREAKILRRLLLMKRCRTLQMQKLEDNSYTILVEAKEFEEVTLQILRDYYLDWLRALIEVLDERGMLLHEEALMYGEAAQTQ